MIAYKRTILNSYRNLRTASNILKLYNAKDQEKMKIYRPQGVKVRL